MTAKAAIKLADLDRALKAAEKAGLRVETEGSVIRFLPKDPGAVLPSDDESAWQRAIGKWRQSA